MMRLAALLLLWCSAAAAQTATIHNYVIGSSTSVRANQVHKIIRTGDKADGMIGQLMFRLQVGTAVYGYGIALGCGVRFNNGDSAIPTDCGVHVFKSLDYTATWDDIGLLYDPTVSPLNQLCAQPANRMCFTPGMIPPTAGHTTQWTFWIQGVSQPCCALPGTLSVLLCNHPGGAAEGGPGDCSLSPTQPGNYMQTTVTNTGVIFQDSDGSAYFAYADGDGWTAPLNTAYNDVTNDSSHVFRLACASCGESASMFKGPPSGSTPIYYFLVGARCAFCTTGGHMVFSASSLPYQVGGGNWPAVTDFDGTGTAPNGGCQGQSGQVVKLTLPDTTNRWVLDIGQWIGTQSEALANGYQMPLSFTGAAINTLTCVDSFTLPVTPTPYPPLSPAIDQTSEWTGSPSAPTPLYFGTDQGASTYTVDSTHTILQTFTPTQASIASFRIFVAQANPGCNNPLTVGNTCLGALGSLIASLVNVNQSTLDPGSVIASQTFTPAQVSWNSVPTTVSFAAQAITPGTHYGLELSCSGCVTSGGGGIYAVTRSLDNPYAGGVMRQQVGAGSWATLDSGNTKAKFSTFGAAPSPGLGGRGISRRVESYLPSIH